MTLDRLDELIVRAFEGTLPEAGQRELVEALRSDPEAQDHYVRQCQLHSLLTEERAILEPLGGEDPFGRDNVVSLPSSRVGAGRREQFGLLQDSESEDEAASAPRPAASTVWARTRFVAYGGACAAAGVVAAIVVGSWQVVPYGSESGEIAVVESTARRRGEGSTLLVREARLSDGSLMELAPRSTVSLRYTDGERALDLRDGEVHFTVVPDPQRPFVVAAGDVQVRAVGTAFNVRRAGQRVVVTVTEGEVEVSRFEDHSEAATDSEGRPVRSAAPRSPGLDAVTVSVGSQVRWDEAEPGPEVEAVDPAEALSWRVGRLRYRREPLGAVVRDLNRYSDRPVVIQDQELEQLRMTATVFTDAISAWLATLPSTLPVRVELEHDRYVIKPRAGREVTSRRGAEG